MKKLRALFSKMRKQINFWMTRRPPSVTIKSYTNSAFVMEYPWLVYQHRSGLKLYFGSHNSLCLCVTSVAGLRKVDNFLTH
jgi:hypothetical protein